MTEPRDRDTVVVTERSSGMGTILAVVAVVVLILAVWYMTLGPGGSGTKSDNGGNTNAPNPTINLPASKAPAAS